MQKYFYRIYFLFICVALTRLSFGQDVSETDPIVFLNPDKSEILDVGFTYWWHSAGPFIGLCGSEYSFVFLGTVMNIKDAYVEDQAYLFKSKSGIVKIDQILKLKAVEKETFTMQKYFESDCFYKSGLVPGDQVIVFCYEYEGFYCIPGRQSLLKIQGESDPKVKSIRSYIMSNQNPVAIEKDLDLWEQVGFGDALRQALECKRMTIEMRKNK